MTFDPDLLLRLRQLQAQLAGANAQIANERLTLRILGSRVLELEWRLRQLTPEPMPQPPGLAPDDLAASVLKALAQANSRLAEGDAGVALVIADLDVSVQGAFVPAGGEGGVRFIPVEPTIMGVLPLGSLRIGARQVPTPVSGASAG